MSAADRPELAGTAIGRAEAAHDTIGARPARAMQLALDEAATLGPGDALPPFWHYLYFTPQIRARDLAADGHERIGGFVPDLGLPRRMWAGGRIEIAAPLRIGEVAERTSTVADVTLKEGRSGRLGFVTVEHAFSVDGAPRLTETQTIVYRAPPAPGAPLPAGPPAPDDAEWRREIVPDPVLLFRYSALIGIAHRIHYDADYARDVEGYPGLLVHGPLTATLLAREGLAHAGGRAPAALEIRATAPLFAGGAVALEGKHDGRRQHLWARTPEGASAMSVTIEYAD